MKYLYELNFDTRLKMTPFCHKWQSVCWFMLKIYAVLKFLVFDRPTFWLLTFSVVLVGTAISLYRANKKTQKNLAETDEDDAVARDQSVLDEQLANVLKEIYKQSSSVERLEETAPSEVSVQHSDTKLIQSQTDDFEKEQNKSNGQNGLDPKPKVLQKDTTRILRLRSEAPTAVMTFSELEEEFLQLSRNRRPKVVHSWEAINKSQANDFEKDVMDPEKHKLNKTAEEYELFKQETEIMRNQSPSPPPMPASYTTGPRRRRYANIRPKVDTNMWKH